MHAQEEVAVFSNNLSDAQLERLAILSEELGEAQQMVGKILRHGWISFSPFDEDKTPNQMLLTKELGDILYAIKLLESNGELLFTDIEQFAISKQERIKPYLHHNSGDIS